MAANVTLTSPTLFGASPSGDESLFALQLARSQGSILRQADRLHVF